MASGFAKNVGIYAISDMILFGYNPLTAFGANILDMRADGKGVYHAVFNAKQSALGYNDFNDVIFNAVTSMERAKYQFSSGGEKYVLWAWKANYITLGAGSELGFYKESIIPGQWNAAKNDAMKMEMTLKDNKGNIIASYDPGTPQWWITSFNPNRPDLKAEDLTASFTVTFNSQNMYDDFYKEWGNDTSWEFDSKNSSATLTY